MQPSVIRRRWEALRDAGYLDDPRLEHDVRPSHGIGARLPPAPCLAVLAAVTLVL